MKLSTEAVPSPVLVSGPPGLAALQLCHTLPISHLLGSLPGVIQSPAPLHRALHHLLPAGLDAHQQVLDQHHVLLLTEELQLVPGLVQLDDAIPMSVHFIGEHLQTAKPSAYL